MRKEIDNTAFPCVFCGSSPVCIHYEADLWYYECSNGECDKHPKYAFMGFRRPVAKEQWNYANRPIQRVSTKRKKDEDGNL